MHSVLLISSSLVLALHAISINPCTSDTDCGGASGGCSIQIESYKYCSKCGSGNIPINGACVTSSNAAGNTCTNNGCTSCTTGYFLHEGSCFNTEEGSPGVSVCDYISLDTDKPTNGYCEQCSYDGNYADNPKKSATTQSCVRCSGPYGVPGCKICGILPNSTATTGFTTICYSCADRSKIAIDNKCVELGGVEDSLSGCKHGTESGSNICTRCGVGYLQYATTCLHANGPYATGICTTANQIYISDTVVCKQCVDQTLSVIDGTCDLFKDGNTCSAGTCTKCDGTKYLYHYGGCYRKISSLARDICSGGVDNDGKCLQCNLTATSGLFTNPKSGEIQACVSCSDTTKGGIAHCVQCKYASSSVTCTKCADGTTPSSNTCNAVTPPGPPTGNCSIPACKTCDTSNNGRCSACHLRTYLNLDNTSCLARCHKLDNGNDHYYGDATTGTCKKCDSSCAACLGPNNSDCTACPKGKYVPSNSGTCIDCSASASHYVGIAKCISCRKLTNSLTCDECETGFAPNSINAQCIAKVTCPLPNCELCSADLSVCHRCNVGHFLMPNKACVTNCEMQGNYASDAENRKCVACPAGCTVCDTSRVCRSCAEGYTLIDRRKCFKCDDLTDGMGVIGVENCVKCTPPLPGQTTVRCLENAPANKSGSQAGMIAGIVIAILIVGALVGFLVWWFVCHNKRLQPSSLATMRSEKPSFINSRTGLV